LLVSMVVSLDSRMAVPARKGRQATMTCSEQGHGAEAKRSTWQVEATSVLQLNNTPAAASPSGLRTSRTPATFGRRGVHRPWPRLTRVMSHPLVKAMM